jgi:hypothetical protein
VLTELGSKFDFLFLRFLANLLDDDSELALFSGLALVVVLVALWLLKSFVVSVGALLLLNGS